MTQPFFAPTARSATVRPTQATSTPEMGRSPKAGLTHRRSEGVLRGTPAPNEGFAFTLADRELRNIAIEAPISRHDVVTGIALLAAKRASLNGRGPTRYDVLAAMSLLQVTPDVTAHELAAFAGVAHSYATQRQFVDGVDVEALRA